MKEKDFALTLARGLAIIEAFSADSQAMTTTQVATKVGVSRAAARRLLLTLVALEYLKHDGYRFSPTSKIQTGHPADLMNSVAWQKVTADVLAISNRFNEPCAVSVLDDLSIVFVIRDQQRRIFSARLSVGDKLPANCSASGKVLLAALDPAMLQKRLETADSLARRTEFSIVDPTELERELRDVRRNGWAKAEDEMEVGTISIAVPLFNGSNNVIAALSAASHKTRRSMDELIEDFLPVIRHAADRISDSLGEDGN